ncbi:MAG: hypothetical protein WCG23_04125 [bacterium]
MKVIRAFGFNNKCKHKNGENLVETNLIIGLVSIILILGVYSLSTTVTSIFSTVTTQAATASAPEKTGDAPMIASPPEKTGAVAFSPAHL